MSSAEVKPFVNAIPFYDLSVAAGGFSEPQSIDEIRWVSLPEKISSPEDFFVCKVVGESMNEVIPNGSFCLFKKNPAGSRNGKIVLVQHHSITDPDNGGTYTVKTYYSEKTQKGDALINKRIVLRPETTAEGYSPIILENGEGLEVIAEFVRLLS